MGLGLAKPSHFVSRQRRDVEGELGFRVGEIHGKQVRCFATNNFKGIADTKEGI